MRCATFERLRRHVAVAAFVIGAVTAHLPASTEPVPAGDSSPPARPLVLVGLDAADWLAIDPLVTSGRLPAFSRLRAQGRTGVMMATPPLISPMIWTTIATGVDPENHGILDFMQDLPDGRQVPVESSQRLAPALWNLFSDGGRRVAVVGWWATWPAEPVRGTIVSDALAPQLTRETRLVEAGLVSPASVAPRVSTAVVKISSVTLADLARYIPITPAEFDAASRVAAEPGGRFYRNPVAHLAAVIASTRTYTSVAEALLREQHPDLLAVYLEGIDTISHLFVRDAVRRARAIEGAYRDADALLQRLARVSTPDTIIIVCSDHGFYSPTSGITEDPSNLAGPAAAWHRPYGIVGVVTAGTLTGTGEEAAFHGPMDLGSITPLDIAPTVLHAAGLPVPIDMPGRVVPAMLPADSAARVPRRTTAAKFTPSPAPRRSDDSGALARLQALGYVGSVRTSLARLNLAESFFRRGRLAQAERELRAVLSQQPANLSAQLWLAQTLDRQGRTSEALNAYGRAVLLPGGAHEALIEATDLAVRTGDIPAARRLIEAAGRAPDVPSVVHVARGALAEAARDARAAEREYRAALDVDPISFDAGARLLDLLVAGGRARAALAAIERAAGLAADSARLAALLGEARLAVRDASGAEVALRRALKLAPDGEATRLALARALLMQQRSAEAIAILAPVGASPDRDVLLGAAYSSSRDWVRASKHLQAALDGGRVTPDVYNGLAWAELQLGRRPEAAALLEKSLEANPNQAEIRRLLARIRNAPPGEDR